MTSIQRLIKLVADAIAIGLAFSTIPIVELVKLCTRHKNHE